MTSFLCISPGRFLWNAGQTPIIYDDEDTKTSYKHGGLSSPHPENDDDGESFHYLKVFLARFVQSRLDVSRSVVNLAKSTKGTKELLERAGFAPQNEL